MTIFDDSDFRESALKRELEREPLHFIDIGARGGVQGFVAPIASLTAVLAFEPDPAGLEELRDVLASSWGRYAVECMGIGGRTGRAKLNLYAHGVNHSLLKASEGFRQRYKVESLEDRGTTDIEVCTLDDMLFNRRADEPYWGELLKLDVQGAEIEILKGAERTLRERTVAVVSEVCFAEIYEDQPRFSDIERFLATRGFTFYGFKYVQGWSQKFIDKRAARGAERLCFGDAVFLRDPLPGADGAGRTLSQRQFRMLHVCALLFGYYDFAIELVTVFERDEAEAGRLIRLADRLASYGSDTAVADVEALLAKMKGRPADANLELARFIESRRYDFDVSDAALARRQPVIAKRKAE